MMLATTSGARKRRSNRLGLTLGVAAALFAGAAPNASAIEYESLGASFTDANGQALRQAGAHGDVRVKFEVPARDPDAVFGEGSFPIEQPHRLVLDLPPGLVGNPTSTDTCPASQLKAGSNGTVALCPAGAQVGVAVIRSEAAFGFVQAAPVYNIERPVDKPALFAFTYGAVTVKLAPTVRAGDFGITMDSGTISQGIGIKAADVTLWGVPADPAHDPLRSPSGGLLACLGSDASDPSMCFNGGASVSTSPKPFLSLPTNCDASGNEFTARLDGWDSVGSFATRTFSEDIDGSPFALTGCENLPFDPAVETRASSAVADAPTGLEVDVRVPQ
ncbi:MAG: hypothetical protein WC558_13310, partial [Patulibacter sp.]